MKSVQMKIDLQKYTSNRLYAFYIDTKIKAVDLLETVIRRLKK